MTNTDGSRGESVPSAATLREWVTRAVQMCLFGKTVICADSKRLVRDQAPVRSGAAARSRRVPLAEKPDFLSPSASRFLFALERQQAPRFCRLRCACLQGGLIRHFTTMASISLSCSDLGNVKPNEPAKIVSCHNASDEAGAAAAQQSYSGKCVVLHKVGFPLATVKRALWVMDHSVGASRQLAL